jgi:peptide/nickel transport system substrate-binding protein
MKKLRWQLLVVVLALVAIGVLLLGQKPVATPGVPEPVQPVSGGVYTEALVGSLGRLNPLLDAYNPADHEVNRLIFSSLIAFDDRGIPQPDLADSWGVSKDGKIYNFSIRPEAVWHDGQPVTSQDVLFTVDLIRNDQVPVPEDLREFWKQVEVKILDEKTLQFIMPEPFAPFLDYLSFGVLPGHLLSDVPAESLVDAEFNLVPVGSGPFRFERLLVEDDQIRGVVLSSFDEFYAEPAFIDEVVFRYYPDAAAAFTAYEQGEVMGIGQVSRAQLPQALAAENLNLYTGRLPSLSLLYFNLKNNDVKFLGDQTVRRALLMGLNRQWIVDRLLGGQAIVAHGPVFPSTWAYYDGIEQVPFDPQAATDMLKDAGYTIPAEGGQVRSKDGQPLAFELVHPDQAPYPEIAKMIQENWAQLGVQVDLKPVAYDTLLADYLEPRSYEAALVDLNLSRTPDPDPYPFWHQTQITDGQNYAGWDDRQASEYLEQARTQVDLTERTKRYRNFQVRFANQLPALPLFYPVYTYTVDETVQGVQMGPLFDTSDRFRNIRSWFLLAESGGSPAAPTPTP